MSQSNSESTPIAQEGYIDSFSIDELLLDSANPRVDTEGEVEQRVLLNKIIENAPDKLLNLIKDIADKQLLNPTEFPMVVRETEDSKPIVVEGNRRLSALRLLDDSSLADDKSFAAKVKMAKDSALFFPSTMKCTVFQSREDCEHWLLLRHTGANEGVGVRPWGVNEKQRHKARIGQRMQYANGFADWVERVFADDPGIMAAMKKIRKDRLTTLNRLLPKVVRDRLGLTFSSDGVLRSAPSPEALKPLLSMWLPLIATGRTADKQQLWSRFSQADTQAYLDSIEDLLPDVEKSVLPIEVEEPKKIEVQPQVTKQQATGHEEQGGEEVPGYGPPPLVGVAKERPRDKLFDSVKCFSEFGGTIKRVAEQANKVSVIELPRVAGAMLRVLMDLCTRHFLMRHNMPAKDDKYLWKRVRDCIHKITSGKEMSDELRRGFELFDKGRGGVGAQTLNDWVHALDVDNASHEVRVMAASCQPIIEAMSRNLSQRPLSK